MRYRSIMGILSIVKLFVHALLALACLTLFTPQTGRAEPNRLNEYEIKAAYLYNFIKFVEWPAAVFPRESSSVTICIVGKSPLNEVIESLAGKTIKNHKLIVRQSSRSEDLHDCNILFINAAAKSTLAQTLASVSTRPILTVSDSKGFAAAGGIIEFVPVEDKIRFKINNRAAQLLNLRISSHLLRLATTTGE